MSETFGNRLKLLRCERQMSQEDLAGLLGTSKQVISRYETNQRVPKITVVNEYASKLNVPLGFLLGESLEEKKPTTASDDELLKSLSSNERKRKFMVWLAGLDEHDLDRIEKLLDAAELLPKE